MFEQFPFVDIAFGPGEVARLGELVARERLDAAGAFQLRRRVQRQPAGGARAAAPGVGSKTVGCNCVCAYCIVPSGCAGASGAGSPGKWSPRSRRYADGVREVTLLGQNVNSYGRDLPREGRATFAELLREAAAVDGTWRVRYTSPHPKDMRDDVIAAMATSEVCEHLHLPPSRAPGS